MRRDIKMPSYIHTYSDTVTQTIAVPHELTILTEHTYLLTYLNSYIRTYIHTLCTDATLFDKRVNSRTVDDGGQARLG